MVARPSSRVAPTKSDGLPPAGWHMTGSALASWTSDHVWETRAADRPTKPSFGPYHMGNRVHPSEFRAAYFPWLAQEWHPTKNELRPEQVTRASGRGITWRCENRHDWQAVVYARTLSKSG